MVLGVLSHLDSLSQSLGNLTALCCVARGVDREFGNIAGLPIVCQGCFGGGCQLSGGRLRSCGGGKWESHCGEGSERDDEKS